MDAKDKLVDSLITSIGQPGKFQVLVCAFLCVNIFITTSNHLATVFYTAKTKYHCKLDGGSVEDLVPTNNNEGEREWNGCRLYSGNNTNVTVPCTNGWTYYLEKGESTVISEFDLVCDNAYKSDLASTIYFCGVTVSGPLFGFLADKYGRKPVIGFTLFSSGIIGVFIVIFRTYIAYVVLRFMLGFVLQGLHNTTISLAMELISTKYRPHVGIILPGSGSFFAFVLDLIAYTIKDWKYIQLTFAILSLVQLATLWILPESIRLLLLHNKHKKAESIIQKVVKFNKIPFPRDVLKKIKENSTMEIRSPAAKKINVFDIFKFAALRKITLILFFVWFSIGTVYYGLAFNISYLPGNKYLNFALSCFLDVIVIFLLYWLVPRYGRRKPLSVLFFICGVASFACSVVTSRASGTSNLKYVATATALLGKSCLAGALSIIYTLTSEVYPTVVRSVSLGVNTVWARAGSMAAPQILSLGRYTASTFVPYIVFGVFAFCSCFLALLLPETHNKALVDRMIDDQGMECLPNDDEKELRTKEMPTRTEEVNLYETTL